MPMRLCYNEAYKLLIGALPYKGSENSNIEPMEMVIILPEEKDGLLLFEV